MGERADAHPDMDSRFCPSEQSGVAWAIRPMTGNGIVQQLRHESLQVISGPSHLMRACRPHRGEHRRTDKLDFWPRNSNGEPCCAFALMTVPAVMRSGCVLANSFES